jgi:hypothetical protein
MMFTIEFFRTRKEDNARAVLDRIMHTASDLESAKVKAKSLFETLTISSWESDRASTYGVLPIAGIGPPPRPLSSQPAARAGARPCVFGAGRDIAAKD